MIKPLGFLPFQTQRWYDAEPWGCNVNTRKSWVSPMASNSIVKLACIYCEPHLEGVVTELGSGWNESLGLHFCVSRHFKKMKGLELEQMLENACILRFHHFIARCPVKTCLFWNEHLFAWLHGGCFDAAIPSFRGLGFVSCRDCQGSWRSVTCQSSVISTTCKRKAPVWGGGEGGTGDYFPSVTSD